MNVNWKHGLAAALIAAGTATGFYGGCKAGSEYTLSPRATDKVNEIVVTDKEVRVPADLIRARLNCGNYFNAYGTNAQTRGVIMVSSDGKTQVTTGLVDLLKEPTSKVSGSAPETPSTTK